jgi:hypothetical protein
MKPSSRQAGPASRSDVRGDTTERDVEELWHRAPRLTLPIPAVREFQKRYETAVPDLPVAAVVDLVSRRAPWLDMVELIERSAPHGFLIYFRNDVHPVMALAGDRADCVAYLMGNHIIAERMFRHDPRAMMYAPLHTVTWGRQTRRRVVHNRPAEPTIRKLRHSRDHRGRHRARPQARRPPGHARGPRPHRPPRMTESCVARATRIPSPAIVAVSRAARPVSLLVALARAIAQLAAPPDDYRHSRSGVSEGLRRLLRIVRWGRDRRRSFRRHPHVGTEHLAESVAAECGVLEPDFRNRYEEKPTYSSV